MTTVDKYTRIAMLLAILALQSSMLWAGEAPKIEDPAPGVTMVYDDNGNWGGGSMGVAHQNQPRYQVRKFIDLSGLPDEVLRRAKEARLRVYFAVQDYSWNVGDRIWNGLNEAFELHVNGNAHRFNTNEGFPGRASGAEKLYWEWYDFFIPVGELKPGVNEFLFTKCPAEKNDDYIYVGIDNTASHGNSQVSFDGGETWTGEKLNAIDAKGEYMVRLVLISGDLSAKAVWRPGPPSVLEDEGGLIGYAGVEGEEARLELDVHEIDGRRPITATIRLAAGEVKAQWTDREGKPLKGLDKREGGLLISEFPASVKKPAALVLTGTTPTEITVAYSRPYLPRPAAIDMCPAMSPPAGTPANRPPSCVLSNATAILENGFFRCRFQTAPRLQLTSLFSELLAKDCVADPKASRLLLIEIEGTRYGAEDFEVRSVKAVEGRHGFVADLLLRQHGLAATLTVEVLGEPELRMGLKLTNEGEAPLTFKVAFPHLDGVCLSEKPEGDYYLFPYYGGTIANVPTYLRTAYGENSAWWQMIDVFSPERGGGLYLRCLDTTGLFKCPTYRKGTGHGDNVHTQLATVMDRSMWWENSLGAGPHSAMTFEYIQRTRKPGESFEAPAACIGVHAGDWRVAMQRYADWAHEVWKWRPYPSRFKDRWSITAPGWGQSPLFKDGAYRTDFIKEGVDVAELMSFWEWSDQGPWGVPMSHETLPKDLGQALYNRYKSYWVINPATGKLQYPINRGDYEYNESWGGLPALRDCVQKVKDSGTLATYYVEGILCCDTTKVGHEYGPIYGVKNPLWKDVYNCPKNPPGYVASYGSYNMCADTEFWPEYLAKTCKRLMKDTGADGLRLDEYGHRGYVCHNDRHKHIYAEPGHNAWMQAVARACRLVHEAMDEVDPTLVLMTEFPGSDHLAATLDGAIVYETMSHIKPFRPVPCNLFRFYFPECKVYDLCHERGLADDNLKFWNASGAFGGLYPDRYYRILRENSDAFDGRDFEALIPTLKRCLYANRFTAGHKTIFMLHNATDFTFDGPVLDVTGEAGRRYFDLLNCREITPVEQDGRSVLRLKIARDWIACIVALPKLLTVTREGNELRVNVAAERKDLRLVLAAEDGERFAEKDARRGANTISLPDEGEAACVKLLAGEYLADVVEMPR